MGEERDLVPVVDEGLGNSAYLLGLGDGSALVVDPPRDLRAVRAAANGAGLRVRFVAETHLHADFLSGGVQLAHDDGAQVLASAAGHRLFPHRGLADGDEVDLGGLTLQAWTTPGHTDEHVCFVVRDGARPVGMFSGGSLIVGSAALTDLSGPERTEELTRHQFRSLQRLAQLPDETSLWPTHGAGSFCSAAPGVQRTSTIGLEKASNALLRIDDEDTFVERLLGSLGTYPPYFCHLGEVNRRGPQLLDTDPVGGLAPLPVSRVERLRRDGALIVDLRPVADYARAHVPGALSVPLRDQFATWLGWLTEPSRPLVLLAAPDQDLADAVWQAVKIGYEQIVGVLEGGIAAWQGAGRPVASIELVGPQDLAGRRVLDTRQLAEFTAGHVPGADHVELGSLSAVVDRLPAEPTVLMCGHGERACGAASLLERAGRRDLAILLGGPQDWAAATGGTLSIGA